jgi:aspartate aminotransferase-like enzyme
MTKQTLCMNPGPIEFEASVLKEMSHEGISHVDKQVIEVFGACLEKMRKVCYIHIYIAQQSYYYIYIYI